ATGKVVQGAMPP
nr:Par o I=pollen major allergen [Parietaria officinalis, Peptide Partial, 12 aa] [Parietaria officinalis]